MTINKINFPIYELMIALSVLIGILYIFLSLKNEKIKTPKIIIFYILFFLLAIIVGKIYTFITMGGQVNIIKVGPSSYGGLIGVAIASIIYEKFFPAKGKVIKYSVLSLPLIYAFGKIGCFFIGCCYGIPYDGPFAVTYPHISEKSLFPIQFLEIIIFFTIFITCNILKDKKNVVYITLLLIVIFKFLLDFLRYSHLTQTISPNQIFSLVLLIVIIIIYVKQKNTKK